MLCWPVKYRKTGKYLITRIRLVIENRRPRGNVHGLAAGFGNRQLLDAEDVADDIIRHC